MRILRIAPGEHYHIFNRAVNKQIIFHNLNDYVRFLFLILYFQAPVKILHISRVVKEFVRFCTGQSRALTRGYEKEIIRKRVVELVSFCIMPNHFHLIVKELEEGGIASYMQRVLTAYSKYYNTKYGKSGHVFQGPYRAVHISDDRQLLHLSAYIHRNPREISQWFRKEDKYPWSSYQDCIGENRWGSLLSHSILVERFKSKKHYDQFIKTSPSKVLENELPYLEELE
ncbi:MAG: transposase [Candidatus Zambryskibacteria bacterium]|nr:transposase [Candidatus Zambryskibacteria bacterium]